MSKLRDKSDAAAPADYWRRKLVAYLHDPPEKAYDYSPAHEQRARMYRETFGLAGDFSQKQADWSAAAADRFIGPRGGPGVALGGGVQFFHPLSGKEARVGSEAFPNQADAEAAISDSLPSFEEATDFQLKHWHAWRLWLHHAVTHKSGQRRGAKWLGYLPADTRNPDGSIWNHCAVTSAIEATRKENGDLAPAFLIFQIGPVQDFIAQAQTTRDFWSGSFLISWLMAHAMKSCADLLGPDAIVFPSLHGQPLYDWLERNKLEAARFAQTGGEASKNFWETFCLGKNQQLPLTPGFPNRFLAVVPADFDVGGVVCTAFKAEWDAIAASCLSWLEEKNHPLAGQALEDWQFQVGRHWTLSWQVLPWADSDAALAALDQIPGGKNSPLLAAQKVAQALARSEHADNRCFRDGKPNTGWAWSAHYQLCQYHLDACRQTRQFNAWEGRDRSVKDAFSGKEEAVVFAGTADDPGWIAQARKYPDLRHLFRSDHPLGAANLIKRVWHKAHLAERRGFNGKGVFAFDSIPSVAAEPWRRKVLEGLVSDSDVWHEFLALQEATRNAADLLDFELPAAEAEGDWLQRVDASIFHASYWENLRGVESGEPTPEEKALQQAGLAALRNLTKSLGSKPATYHAVLALDGDEIGKWLSGENTPKMREVMTDEAVAWFEKNLPDSKPWLDGNRPISPAYHLGFSEALANFGLYCVRRIVEAHGGQLIYAGGDDVLALLPADEAMDCARGLRLAFQGQSSALVAHGGGRYAHLFEADVPIGFIQLKDGDWQRGCRRPSEPSWPLLVPGPRLTVSVGIAIGHMKEPLQDMINEAQQAEKDAKTGLGRDALAVRLFKRSGEQVKWGVKFDSPAFDLLGYLGDYYRAPIDRPDASMPIHGKFPYRVCSMLSVYPPAEALTAEIVQIAKAEMAWIVKQNTDKDSSSGFQQTELLERCCRYLDSLADPQAHAHKPGTLRDFCGLFAVEAFLARQGDNS